MAAQTSASDDHLIRDDIVAKVADQHDEIRAHFAAVLRATGAARRRELNDLQRLVTAHDAAEQMIVRPLCRALLGDAEADARNDEELDLAGRLDELSRADLNDADVTARIQALADVAEAHARAEESGELAAIRDRCDDDLRVQSARLFEVAFRVPRFRHRPAGPEGTLWTVIPMTRQPSGRATSHRERGG